MLCEYLLTYGLFMASWLIGNNKHCKPQYISLYCSIFLQTSILVTVLESVEDFLVVVTKANLGIVLEVKDPAGSRDIRTMRRTGVRMMMIEVHL